MKNLSRSKITFTGLAVTVVVMLVGVVGYMRVLKDNSEVAVNAKSTPAKFEAPAISKTSDLDKAASTLDSAQLNDDLSTLSDVASQF